MSDRPHSVETKDDARAKRRAVAIQCAACLPLIALVLTYYFHDSFRQAMGSGIAMLARGDLNGLREWGDALGAWAAGATTLLMIAQALAAPIPAVFVTATNSYLFGPNLGGALSILQANAAALVCYFIARIFGDALVRRMISPAALNASDNFIRRHGAEAVVVARLLPFVPFDPVSYVAGLTRMHPWTIFWATLLGQIPAGMAYAHLAQQVHQPYKLAVNAACVIAALFVAGWAARRTLIRRRSLDET